MASIDLASLKGILARLEAADQKITGRSSAGGAKTLEDVVRALEAIADSVKAPQVEVKEVKASPAPAKAPEVKAAAPAKVEEKKAAPAPAAAASKPAPAPASKPAPSPAASPAKPTPAPAKVEEKKAPAKVEEKKSTPAPAAKPAGGGAGSPTKTDEKKTPAKAPVNTGPPAAGSVEEAWAHLTHDNSPVNWIVIGFKSDGKMALTHSGTSGIADLQSKLDEKEVQFAALKVVGVDEQANVTSKRAKYVGITFIGKSVSPLKRGRALTNADFIAKLFQGVTLSVQYEKTSDLAARTIGKLLLAAGGAHKPKYYDFGGGEKIEISALF